MDKNFFIKQNFSEGVIEKYKKSARHTLDIAITSKEQEVVFHFLTLGIII